MIFKKYSIKIIFLITEKFCAYPCPTSETGTQTAPFSDMHTLSHMHTDIVKTVSHAVTYTDTDTVDTPSHTLSHLKSLAETDMEPHGRTHPAQPAERLTERHTQKLGQTYRYTHTH